MTETRNKMAEAIEAWGKEDAKNRNILVIFGDSKEEFTSCGYAGNEVDLVGCIVNEMFEDEIVARVLNNAVKVYEEVLKEEQEEKKKENKTNKTKKYLS